MISTNHIACTLLAAANAVLCHAGEIASSSRQSPAKVVVSEAATSTNCDSRKAGLLSKFTSNRAAPVGDRWRAAIAAVKSAGEDPSGCVTELALDELTGIEKRLVSIRIGKIASPPGAIYRCASPQGPTLACSGLIYDATLTYEVARTNFNHIAKNITQIELVFDPVLKDRVGGVYVAKYNDLVTGGAFRGLTSVSKGTYQLPPLANDTEYVVTAIFNTGDPFGKRKFVWYLRVD